MLHTKNNIKTSLRDQIEITRFQYLGIQEELRKKGERPQNIEALNDLANQLHPRLSIACAQNIERQLIRQLNRPKKTET